MVDMYEADYAAAYARALEVLDQQIAVVTEIFDDTQDTYWVVRLAELNERRLKLNEAHVALAGQ